MKARKLRKMIARSGGYPSFRLLLSVNYDNSDDETPDEDVYSLARRLNASTETPIIKDVPVSAVSSIRSVNPTSSHIVSTPISKPTQMFKRERLPAYIDVDVELGLKSKKPRSNYDLATVSLDTHRSPPPLLPTAETTGAFADSSRVVSAADQGYYSGVAPVALPEDSLYLNDVHVWTRRQLEFFSATLEDTKLSQSGRRIPIVVGRVGLRCKHCSAVLSPSALQSVKGSISYPVNLSGIYTSCMQRSILHFDQYCTHLTHNERQFRDAFLVEASATSLSSLKRGLERGYYQENNRFNNRSSSSSASTIPTSTYYSMSAKRLGIVEGEDGLRFARDLSLEPLPIDIMLLDEETYGSTRTETGFIPSEGTKRDQVANLETYVLFGEGGAKSSPEELRLNRNVEPRITADHESEQILVEAILEADDSSRFLGHSDDLKKATDWFFLLTRQMAVCHAVPFDFMGKGKKGKALRVGFAGFCCRYCIGPSGVYEANGCRCFPSSADILSTSIANSFATHLQKCEKVPLRIKKALAAYKRLHQGQLALLPYGSQRRIVHDLWARLRAIDVTEEGMLQRIQFCQPSMASIEKDSL